MAIDKVKAYFKAFGKEMDVMEFPVSSATVELAAQAVGCEPARLYGEEGGCILIVAAGDRKIDNSKFKHVFGKKAKMLAFEDVEPLTGHAPGGVCPFANPADAKVYLDISLQRFETVFPACGSANSAIELTCGELEQYANSLEWVDVCKEKGEAPA